MGLDKTRPVWLRRKRGALRITLVAPRRDVAPYALRLCGVARALN